MELLAPAAIQTLEPMAALLEAAQDDWWLIGGAAVALHGLAIDIADVDMLLSARDIHQVIATLHIRPKEAPPSTACAPTSGSAGPGCRSASI